MSAYEYDVLFSPEDPDAAVPVTAVELFEWAWLSAELADWLTHAADTTAFDFARYFGPSRTREGAVGTLEHIREHIGGLLDGGRGRL